MVNNAYFFIVALICGAVCNPLGQTTICDTQNRLPGLLPPIGATTVCDTPPNLLGLGYALRLNLPGAPYLPLYLNGLGTTVCDTLPNMGLSPLGPSGLNPQLGSSTVCENVPNLGLDGLGPLVPGSSTVYESIPNVGLGIGGYGLGGLGGLGGILGQTNLDPISRLNPLLPGHGHLHRGLGALPLGGLTPHGVL